MEFTEYTVEKIRDAFGIVQGERYEFMIEFEVDEEDELYTPQGLLLRVIYSVDGDNRRIVKHEIIERGSQKVLDFDLEDDELAETETFCAEHYTEGEILS
ncbi:pullulanase [Saccharibacillus sp. O16]|nr:pullulanase [Saccharibacillus sp. O16]